jgi:hypothetical protein
MTLLVLRLEPPGNLGPFIEGIRNAFGLGGAGAVADNIPLLGAGEYREFVINGSLTEIGDTVRRLAQSSECILAIVLDATADRQNCSQTPNPFETELMGMLAASAHYAVLNIFLQVPNKLYEQTASRPDLKRFGLADLDERDLRVPLLGLQVLKQALALLMAANGSGSKVRLFFSHAKKDGVPIATAAGDWMGQRLKGFDAFYDTTNLDLTGDIDAQLQSAIRTAVVIVFRTEVFD